MAITLIDKKQIHDYFSFTGDYFSTGFRIIGNISAPSGLISGISGKFDNLEVDKLTVNGALVSNYLSGILGTTTTGSGILHFLAIPDVSGNNEHYRAVFSTGNPANPIQSFSTQNSQAEWQYFNSSSWSAFPAIGLNSAEQQSSIVRLLFKPTGFDVFNTYFVHTQTIFAGNITGNFSNSLQFKANANGFTLAEMPSLQSFFETADSRYVRKAQIGLDFVASGVKISGLSLILPTFAAIPSTNHGTGTLIQSSGILFNYHETPGFSGYQRVSNYTGIAPSGSLSATGPLLYISGLGQIVTSVTGNIITISGGGVNQFAASSASFRQGNLILSGEGGLGVREILTTSGTVIAFSGSAGSGGGGSSTLGGVTGFGPTSLNPLFTGGFVVSGGESIIVNFTNVQNGISGFNINFNDNDIMLALFNTIGY
jgi:hypothetical protein